MSKPKRERFTYDDANKNEAMTNNLRMLCIEQKKRLAIEGSDQTRINYLWAQAASALDSVAQKSDVNFTEGLIALYRSSKISKDVFEFLCTAISLRHVNYKSVTPETVLRQSKPQAILQTLGERTKYSGYLLGLVSFPITDAEVKRAGEFSSAKRE